MRLLRQLFGQPETTHDDPNYSEDLATIEARLSTLPQEQARYLAAFALVLARVAGADLEISPAEVLRIRDALQKHSRLTPDQIEVVAALALERILLNSVEGHIVLRELDRMATPEQKRNIIRSLFYVAAADDISELESEEIATIAKGMGFSRQDFLALRSEFRDHLAVLKPPR